LPPLFSLDMFSRRAVTDDRPFSDRDAPRTVVNHRPSPNHFGLEAQGAFDAQGALAAQGTFDAQGALVVLAGDAVLLGVFAAQGLAQPAIAPIPKSAAVAKVSK
jgi:hypothetical protein